MRILSILDVAPVLRERPGYWDVISVGPDLPPTKLCRRHLWLECDDVLSAATAGAGAGWRAPVAQHVGDALAFAREAGDDRLIVHCHAGVSRSPAIAWCILLDRLGSPAAATATLFELRPIAIPNRVIIRLGLEMIAGSTAEYDAILADMLARSKHPLKELMG